VADALRALWRTETEGFPLSRVLLPDRQPDPIEIDIAPAEAEQLAAPHARCRGDVVQRKLPVLRREGKEGSQFVSGPCPHLRPVEGKTLLEVGGGIGAIEIELLKAGMARAINVELTPTYEAAARELLVEAGLTDVGGRGSTNRVCFGK
jgi:hypothetical protein